MERVTCNFCEKTFKTKDSERKHGSRIHNQYVSNRKLTCEEDGCGQKFFKLHTLRNHLKIRHGYGHQDRCDMKGNMVYTACKKKEFVVGPSFHPI